MTINYTRVDKRHVHEKYKYTAFEQPQKQAKHTTTHKAIKAVQTNIKMEQKYANRQIL